MNATLLAQSAYGNPDQAVRTPRDIEYEAFARTTRRLKQASENAADFPALVRAIHDNRHLWSILASDVSRQSNGLPLDLRKGVYTLAQFTRKQSQKILRGEASVDTLIEINTAIMRGLRQERGIE